MVSLHWYLSVWALEREGERVRRREKGKDRWRKKKGEKMRKSGRRGRERRWERAGEEEGREDEKKMGEEEGREKEREEKRESGIMKKRKRIQRVQIILNKTGYIVHLYFGFNILNCNNKKETKVHIHKLFICMINNIKVYLI